MKAVISVLGQDKIGILAAVANACANCQVNILEVSQTILHGIFSMTMIVDCDQLSISFEEFSDEMSSLGESMGLEIKAMNKKIFDAMHQI